MGSRRRIRSYGLAAAVGLGVLATGLPAGASVAGRRNTAYALTAVAIYSMAKGNTKAGLVTGAGAAYAWKRTVDEKKANDRARARARGCRTHRVRYVSTTSCRRTTAAHHHHARARYCRTRSHHHVAKRHHSYREYARR
jgi:ABC-type nickel/cobalt efflux system permease component RcnA